MTAVTGAARDLLLNLDALQECRQERGRHAVGGYTYRPNACPACTLRAAIAAEDPRDVAIRHLRDVLAVVADSSLLWEADIIREYAAAHLSGVDDQRGAPIINTRALLGRCATALEHLRDTVASGAAPLTPEAGLAHVKKLHAHIGLDPDVVGECLQVGAALRSAGVEPTPSTPEVLRHE